MKNGFHLGPRLKDGPTGPTAPPLHPHNNQCVNDCHSTSNEISTLSIIKFSTYGFVETPQRLRPRPSHTARTDVGDPV